MKFPLDQLIALSEDMGGACIGCGEEAFGIEPDARGYECEECGCMKVYGAEELIIMGRAE